MRTYNFISEFTYELPDNTLTITVTGKMWPGTSGTYYDPPEGPEIDGDFDMKVEDENGEPFTGIFTEKQEDEILQLIYDNAESTEDDDEI